MSEADKKKKAPRRNRSRIVIFLGIAMLLLMLWIVGGYSINPPPDLLLNQIQENRDLWESHDINSYRIAITREGSVSWLTLVNGKPIRFERDSRFLGMSDDYDYKPEVLTPVAITPDLERTFDSVFPLPFEAMNIDNLFIYLETDVKDHQLFISTCWNTYWRNPDIQYTVEFNDQYGYIKSIVRDWTQRWQIGLGVLCSYSTDQFSLFYIVGFEPIEASD